MTSDFDYPSTAQESGFIDVHTRAGETRSIFVLSVEAFDELTPTQSDYDRADAMFKENLALGERRSTKEIIFKHILKK